jgi:NDP-sugar pyrophosphorylase family protein
MDAMILAAGVGSRLGEVTRERPKALVSVGGVPAMERVARRLVAAGADRLIINVHHFAEQIVDYVREHDGFGVETRFSHETEVPLETGGGLLQATPLFRRDAPFFLHNVDVLTDLDLGRLYARHRESGALATLAVQQRESSRYLLFDQHGLCGRLDRRRVNAAELHATAQEVRHFAFAGVHVVSPELLDRITERGRFSIIDVYLRLAGEGAHIAAFDIGRARWLEIGSPERLAEARQAYEQA